MAHSEITLETLAQNFKAWRGNNHHLAYPKQFWKDIIFLSRVILFLTSLKPLV